MRFCGFVTAVVALVVVGWSVTANALAPGDFDPSFGSAGTVITQLGAGAGRFSVANSVAPQPDGKIVAAGYATDSAGHHQFAVVRFNADGTLDSTFDSAGKLIVQLGAGGSPSSVANAVAVQSDGKIVAAGSATDSAGNNQFAVVRLNADGSFDSTFGSAGKVIVQLGAGASPSSLATALALQSDGKVVAAGQASDSSGNRQFAVVRLNANGSFDSTSFGSAGKVIVLLGTGADLSPAYAVALQSDGKIVASGYARDSSGNDQFTVVRLNGDGSFDSTFGSTGKVIVQLGAGASPFSYADAVAVQSDAKIAVAARVSDSAGHDQFAVVRLNGDGSFDSSFGSAGKVVAQLGAAAAPFSDAYAVALQSDGKIVAAGRALDSASHDQFALVRLNSDGSFDSSFGSAGKVIVQPGAANPSSDAYAVAVQSDGKIVASGYASDSSGFGALLVARLIADVPPTASFTAAPNPVQVGQPVAFNGGGSSDPDGTIANYAWNFGDGAAGSGATTSHAYTKPGSYTASLTVRDNYGLTATATQMITVAPVVFTKLVLLGSAVPSRTGVSFSVLCQAAVGAVCQGLARLTTLERLLGFKILALSARNKRHNKRISIGSKPFTLAAGARQKIVVPLNSTGHKLLARFHRIPATLTITLLNTKPPTTIATKATIRANKKKKRKHH